MHAIKLNRQLLHKSLLASLAMSSVLLCSACTITDVTSSTSHTLDAVTPDITLNRFVDVRIASIKQEAAVGQGENLNALAHLMGREDNVKFSDWMQSNYHVLFSDLEQPSELVSRIETLSSIGHI